MPTSDNEVLLQVNHLSIGYGKRQVLFDVSLEVKRGEIVLLIGGNGSGKSTLLKAIYGLVPDGLKVQNKINENWVFSPLFNLNDCIKFDNENIKKGLVYIPQKNNTFDQLTVIENLEVVTNYLKNKAELKKRVNMVFEQLPQLAVLRNRIPFHLSGGEKQQLALGIALMQQPKMIMLDEPGAGLSPNAWQRNLELIKILNVEGITFLIVEHRVKESLLVATRLIGLKLGRIFSDSLGSEALIINGLNTIFN
jgi:ABC-type branched-subunit amino acid transport system ATPase component